MMTLEQMKKEEELMRVVLARRGQEIQLRECQERIERINKSLEIQLEAEQRLTAELKTIQGAS